MTRRQWGLSVAALVAAGLVSLGGLRWTMASADRPDCPGKIICPQTGELVCRDRCPTVDPDRPDCPGRIVCPQTGELVCIDRCPLESKAADQTPVEAPPCCTARK